MKFNKCLFNSNVVSGCFCYSSLDSYAKNYHKSKHSDVEKEMKGESNTSLQKKVNFHICVHSKSTDLST